MSKCLRRSVYFLLHKSKLEAKKFTESRVIPLGKALSFMSQHMCSLPDLNLGCWTPGRVCIPASRGVKIKRICVLRLHKTFLLEFYWIEPGHLDTVIQRKMKIQLFCWVFFYTQIHTNVFTTRRGWSRLGKKTSRLSPHSACNNLDPEVLYKLGASHRMMNIQWKTGGISYGWLIISHVWFIYNNKHYNKHCIQ